MAISTNGIRIRISASLLFPKCGLGWVAIPPTGVPDDVKEVLSKYAGKHDDEDDRYIMDLRLDVTDNTWEAVLDAARASIKETNGTSIANKG